MTMAKHCLICTQKILSHSRVLKCMVCNLEYHIACCNITRDEASSISPEWYCATCVQDCIPFYNIVDDGEFKSTIFSLHSDKPIDASILDNLAFNPFEWNQENDTPLADADPDIQYFSNPSYSNSQICDYHTEETFNKYAVNKDLIASKGISIFSHNVRSLPRHNSDMNIFIICFLKGKTQKIGDFNGQ